MHEKSAALKQFRQSPGFSLTVTLTIALGVGANTAIFTLVNALLLHSLPISSPGTLYRVGDGHEEEGQSDGFTYMQSTGDFSMFSAGLYHNIVETTP